MNGREARESGLWLGRELRQVGCNSLKANRLPSSRVVAARLHARQDKRAGGSCHPPPRLTADPRINRSKSLDGAVANLSEEKICPICSLPSTSSARFGLEIKSISPQRSSVQLNDCTLYVFDIKYKSGLGTN
jgi:hypothetical protein